MWGKQWHKSGAEKNVDVQKNAESEYFPSYGSPTI
jgi:hypothetical protein